ncbi:serine hydrolase domain-containing protein [Nocardia ninae]
MPGLAAAVWWGSEPYAAAVTGFRKRNDPTPVTIGDRWHLGSNTKAMTATLIGLFVDRGVVRFEDQLNELLGGDQLHPGYAAVTVEQLLQHRGGAPENPPPHMRKHMSTDGIEPAAARAAAVTTILADSPAHTPGKYAYSNVGYMILGAALQRLCGASWESLMRTELFTPLRMNSAGFGGPGSPGTTDQPWGHNSTLEPMPPGPLSDNPPAFGPAGTVHCTLTDWGRFLGQHLAGARGAPSILSTVTMARLHQPARGGDYAAGWIVLTPEWANGPVLTHTGSNTLWTAETLLAPANNLIFAVVTNCGDDQAHQAVDDVTGWLIDNCTTGQTRGHPNR